MLGATAEVTGHSPVASGWAGYNFEGPILFMLGEGFLCSVLAALWSRFPFKL